MKKVFADKIVALLLTAYTCILFLGSCTTGKNANEIDLAGEWSFQIDSLDKGTEAKWFANELNDKIKLPGSMSTNGKGYDVTADTKWTGGIWDSTWYKSPDFAKYRQPGNVKVAFWLQPDKYYTGAAWYQKKVSIPENWGGRYTELFLERCHWETTLWVDMQKVGMQNALSAPHVYDLSKYLSPGEHTITIRIDNRIKDIDPGKDAHSVSDNTQTNWNGIIGKMTLTNRPAVSISDIQLYPDIHEKLVRAHISIRNLSQQKGNYQLNLSAAVSSGKAKGESVAALTKNIEIEKDTTVIDIDYPMGSAPLLWDEFDPNLYTLTTSIDGDVGSDKVTTDFGMREFVVDGKQFRVNGRNIFLRGTLECAIFPKTGFPSTSLDDWLRIYKKCKEYGLNHVRFHSYAPPEAAFHAADMMGIYLSVENSAWAHLGTGAPIDQYIYDESNRIVKQYGNHPSYCMMPYGNEASGDSAVPYLTHFLKYWKAKDKRRVYTSASGFPSSPASDYESSGSARIQWWEAGLTSPINAKAPTSDYDWTPYLSKDKPTVSHEIGQWCVYPDFKDISKYDGVLKPKNFEIFNDMLKEHGMEKLADSFLLASGKLQVLCYKADIEAALRTPSFAGFQLLDLHDFPGQGTALVGVLNPFWEEKGYVTGKEYSQFCNAVVPLLRMNKMIYLDNETFSARAEITNYSKEALQHANPVWKITHADGRIVATGKFNTSNIPLGLSTLGDIKQDLSSVTRPEELTVTITAGNFENSWNIWVYPATKPAIVNENKIKVVQALDAATIAFLNNGGNALLTVKKGAVRPGMGGDIPVGFSSIFWNTQWTAFKQPPFTLGILCDPAHPALSQFPTEFYSNWQWWDAMSHCNAIRLDSVSSQIKPIVRVIDDWFTARPLGLVFEFKVGKGKLLVSGIDLLSDNDKRPEAKQLLYSLINYMAGSSFNPAESINLEKIKSIFN